MTDRCHRQKRASSHCLIAEDPQGQFLLRHLDLPLPIAIENHNADASEGNKANQSATCNVTRMLPKWPFRANCECCSALLVVVLRLPPRAWKFARSRYEDRTA